MSKTSCGWLKKLAHKFGNTFDFFSNSTFINQKGESQFYTCSGLSVSIAFIIMFLYFGFYPIIQSFTQSPGSAIVNEQTIASYNSLNFDIVNTESKPFSFMIGIKSAKNNSKYLNLNDETASYFKIRATQKARQQYTASKISQVIYLEPCQADMWSTNNTNIENLYEHLQLDKWLCPIQNQSFQLFGNINAKTFKYLKISVQTCTDSSNITCVSQAEVDALEQEFGEFLLNVYFINAIVNPNNSTILDFELEDKNFISFTQKSPSTGNIYFSPLRIQTDDTYFSLSFKQNANKTELHNTATETVNQRSTFLHNNIFAKIYFRSKEEFETVYQISYPKIDTVFQSISGLFGIFMVAFIFLKAYSKANSDLTLSNQFLVTQNRSTIDVDNFTVFHFLGYKIRSLFRYLFPFCCKALTTKDIKQDETYFIRMKSLELIDGTFDITSIMKRIMLLETRVQTLIENIDDQEQKWKIKSQLSLDKFYLCRLSESEKLLDEQNKIFNFRKSINDSKKLIKKVIQDNQPQLTKIQIIIKLLLRILQML